jgi:adenine-specific DNA-methyltransferase
MDVTIAGHYSQDVDVTLFHGDRLHLLQEIEQQGSKAQLIITSPPYNLGKEYEKVVTPEEYIESQKETITACAKILSPIGSICWQVGHYIEGSGRNKEAFPLDIVLYPVFKGLGLKLRNRIVWHFGHGLHENFRFSGRHETILWFTHDTPDYKFYLDPIRVPQKYPGKRAFRGVNKGKPSGNPKGKNPSDVWDMPNVKSNHIEKTDHPCQFPIALVERLLLATTDVGDLVVDPYMGVGTAAVTAILHGRKAAGADIQAEYLKIAVQRVMKASQGTLQRRPLNKPLYEPDGKSAVSQLPQEWTELK